PPPLDARVRAWLVAHRAPIHAGGVPSMRVGRVPARGQAARRAARARAARGEALVHGAEAAGLLPLVDRDALVGLVTVTLPEGRTARPAERELIADAAQSAAQALSFAALRPCASARCSA